MPAPKNKIKKKEVIKIINNKLASAVLVFIVISQIAFAGDVTINSGNAELQKDNEIYLSLKNTEANGKDWRLVSAGTAGGIGVGKFSVYDTTAGKDRLTVDTNGNMGVGTANPQRLLHILKSDAPSLMLEETQAGEARQWSIGANANLFQISDVTAGAERVTINSGGNVGIGTTGPVARFQATSASGQSDNAYFTTNDFSAVGQTGSSLNLRFGASSGNTYSEIRALSTGSSAWNNLILQSGGGNVGIGTTSPSYKLQVSGGSIYTDSDIYLGTRGTWLSSWLNQALLTSSNVQFNQVTAGAFFYSSDLALKENIIPVKGLETINKLNGVKFTWKNTGEKSAGLIAQDVEKVLPEAVSIDNSTGMKSLNYGALTAPIVESVKELNQKSIEQDKKIIELQNEIQTLKQEIKSLK